jgi:uncharacterized coiled-coil DUF342 family protein
MPRKKNITSKELAEMSTGIRLSTHEKICAERMKTLFKTMDEVKKEIKELRSDVSKGKGAINLLIILGGLVGVLLGFLKWNG